MTSLQLSHFAWLGWTSENRSMSQLTSNFSLWLCLKGPMKPNEPSQCRAGEVRFSMQQFAITSVSAISDEATGVPFSELVRTGSSCAAMSYRWPHQRLLCSRLRWLLLAT
jgi:hypothetical protein